MWVKRSQRRHYVNVNEIRANLVLYAHPQSIKDGVDGRSSSGRSTLRRLLLLAVGLLTGRSSVLSSLLLLARLAVASSTVGTLSAGGSAGRSAVLALTRLAVRALLLLLAILGLLLRRSTVLALLALLSSIACAKE